MINFSEIHTYIGNFVIQPLTHFLHLYPHSSGIITFCVVCMETMAVIGVIFPGVIIMPVIGFLMGTNVIPFGSTLLYAIAGAITGDYISYFLGIYFQGRIHSMWPFTKWPGLLEQGEKYFRAHGGKSIFIGRFVMVVRTMLPLIGGMLKMPLVRFSIAAIPSAAMWAVGYMLPGILLGALSLELQPKAAAEFTLYVFLTMAFIGLIAWLLQYFFKQTWKIIDRCVARMWKYYRKNKTTMWITEILSDPRKPDNHQQLTLVMAAAFSCILFFFTLYQVLTHGFLTNLDKPIYYLLSSLRTRLLDYIAIMITMLGDGVILIIASSLFLMWLLWKRYFYIAAHWFGAMSLSVSVVFVTKFLINMQRPNDILDIKTKFLSSFPSGHTAMSLVLYGFLAVIIARESKKQNRSIPYTVSGVILALIALSRLYLGMHWLTDVIGGFFIGSAIILIVTISYRRRHNLHFSARKITLTALCIFASVWLGYSAIKFNEQVKESALVWNAQEAEPLYRLNRFGDVTEALNIEFVGNIETFKQSLIKQGWKAQPVKIDFMNIVKGFFDSEAIYHLPIFPQLYQNQLPVLLLTKKTDQDNTILVLHLWALYKANNVWVGAIRYYRHDPYTLSIKNFKNKRIFVGATEDFVKYLKDFQIKNKFYLQNKQPPEMKDLHWDGKLLIIKD